MLGSKIANSDNQVNGDLVNVNNNSGTINIGNALPPITEKLQEIMNSLMLEMQSDNKRDQLIDELNHFMTPHKRKIRTLAEKLHDGGFIDSIDDAEECKEQIMKLITKYKNFNSGQELILTLLTSADFKYANSKLELKKLPEKTYNSLSAFLCNLTSELFTELQRYNSITLRKDHFLGLFFYLAGQCHIDFDI